MLVRHIVTAFLATISLLFTYKVTTALSNYIFGEVFEQATFNFEQNHSFEQDNFETTFNFEQNHSFQQDIFETTFNFDLYEDILNAFESVHSFEPADATTNADSNLGDSHSSTSDFSSPSPSSSSESPRESPSSSSDAPSDPPPTASKDVPTKTAPATTGHSGRSLGIGVAYFFTIFALTIWFMSRKPPPPPPPLNPHELWPSSWICGFPCAMPATTTIMEPADRRLNRLGYFSRRYQRRYVEEELESIL